MIDSEASMRARLTRRSEQAAEDKSAMKDAEEAKIDAGKKVAGNGVVKRVRSEQRKLKLQHEPIEALGWPAMSMDFAVADGVDLSDLSVDDIVMVQLQQRDDRYLITSIHIMNTDSSNI